MPPVVGDNLVISSWDSNGGRWAAPVLNQAAADASVKDNADSMPPFIARVPQSAGLIVAGTIEGRGKLGVASQTELGVAGEVSVFLVRINSEHGIGCPAP